VDQVGLANGDIIAIGEAEPDLAMFRVARRSFAPRQMGCPGSARMLGCQIARRPFQAGLLSIVRELVHPGGGRCRRCKPCEHPWPRGDLFLDLLATADGGRRALLLRALLDPQALQVFRQ
jgi:hypothetical protein